MRSPWASCSLPSWTGAPDAVWIEPVKTDVFGPVSVRTAVSGDVSVVLVIVTAVVSATEGFLLRSMSVTCRPTVDEHE